MAEDEELMDGCSVSYEPDTVTADDDVDALVLFADVDFTDTKAVKARKDEWKELL